MSRKPGFWIALSLISISGVLFTFKYFSEAFPIVTLDLRMDRHGALQLARTLAAKFQWGPKDFSQAASFDLDSEVQNYVELEVGGSHAFKELLRGGLYSPYLWRVRHFKEGNPNESVIRFTPEGSPYGFREKLPEDAPGASLDTNQARGIAEKAATEQWQILLNQFVAVETSQEERPGGRRDHTFVYERPDKKIGEGLYRLRLVVGGDRLIELTHFIKVPEAFERRYEEMRSANETLASVAQYVVLVLYLGGGCIIGFFFLLRHHWLIWKKPLAWAVFIAFLNFLGSLSALPLSWMSYNTALSARAYLIQQILFEIGGFALWTLVLALSFMAAEGLTRRAFPHMIQLWKLWSPETGSTYAVLGRTIGGYLIMGFDFAFVVAIYFVTTRHFGWWTPSDSLFEPNLLATYFPWLSGVAQSLQAGFWEECLFRAVPLAGAAILGQKFGKRRLFIGIAFLLQAVIFGAGHANYPSQPAYARLVELIIPSFVFGGIYLTYGLLPSIISHFTFDVVWFSLPLFISTAKGIWLDRAMVVLLTLTPLWIVLRVRLRKGSWGAVPKEAYNAFWKPLEPPPFTAEPAIVETSNLRPFIPLRWVIAGGLGGLILWLLGTNFKQDGPALSVGRRAVVEIARQALEKRGVTLNAEWKAYPLIRGQIDSQDRFIWQTGGRKIYHQLVDPYLPPPGWEVRFARFNGDVVQRAEEYNVEIGASGIVTRLHHTLPESAPGASLSEGEARVLAQEALKSQFQMMPETLKEISAESAKLPSRQDWTFTFSDPNHFPLKEGQARTVILVAGKEIADFYGYIFVPEEWERKETSRANILDLIVICCWAILLVGLLVAGIMGIVHWSRRRFPVGTFVSFFVILALAQILGRLNHWPATLANLSTAEPVSHQLFKSIAGSLVSILLQSAFMALVLGFIQTRLAACPVYDVRNLWKRGVCLALAVTGLIAILNRFIEPSLAPRFASYSQWSTYVPIVDGALAAVHLVINSLAMILFYFVTADRLTSCGIRRKLLGFVIFLVLGLSLAGLQDLETVSYWAMAGIFMGLCLWGGYLLVARFGLICLVYSVGTIFALSTVIQMAYHAFPHAIPAGIIQIITIALLCSWSAKKLGRGMNVSRISS
ncbi:MAG: CPBP family intramembrane glutamic endopeptidase [Terriglobia bacterium]